MKYNLALLFTLLNWCNETLYYNSNLFIHLYHIICMYPNHRYYYFITNVIFTSLRIRCLKCVGGKMLIVNLIVGNLYILFISIVNELKNLFLISSFIGMDPFHNIEFFKNHIVVLQQKLHSIYFGLKFRSRF